MSVDFPATALPYGVFSRDSGPRRLGVGLGNSVVDLEELSRRGEVSSVDPALLQTGSLDDLLAAGTQAWEALRQELMDRATGPGFGVEPLHQDEVTMHLAWTVADYVDFYSSRYHAENVGRMFRPDREPLMPNWLHLPVGYHGRSGTVVVDGTPIRRPCGQRRTSDGIEFGPSTRLDIELEVGFVLGGQSDLGEPVPITQAHRHLFGVVLLNDWSARDIQAWEYVPLGPFLGKSFATSVSAWVMPMTALDGARAEGPPQTEPVPLPYLRTDEPRGLSLDLEVWMKPAGAPAATRIAGVNTAQALYWSAAQQMAHMTVNGATIRPGDLFASGTVSGPTRAERGSLLELTWSGTDPIEVDGWTRTFLEDGDQITLTGSAPGPQGPIPLGPVSGVIQPA
ncbi:MAG: fumarylacetoacetase [Acidimicrobiia bacterium]